MNKLFKKIYYFITPIFFVLVSKASAAGLVPESGKTNGDYQLNDFLQLGINISQWILGIVGSLSLLMFIYGGFMMLISAGSAEKVESGKKIIIGAVIGLIIVFASYLIIKFSMSALGLNWNGTVSAPTVIIQ